MNPPSISSQILLESLRQAVANALERKRRLGQYAVVWRDGQPAILESDLPPTPDTHPSVLREEAAPYASAPVED